MVKDFGFSLGLYPNEVLSSNQAQYRTRSAAHWIHSYFKVAQQQLDKNKPDKNEWKTTQKLKLSFCIKDFRREQLALLCNKHNVTLSWQNSMI